MGYPIYPRNIPKGGTNTGPDWLWSKTVKLISGKVERVGVDIPFNDPEYVISIWPIPLDANADPSVAIERTKLLAGVIYVLEHGVGAGGFVNTPILENSFNLFVGGNTARQPTPIPFNGICIQGRGRSTLKIAVDPNSKTSIDGTEATFLVQAYPGRITEYPVPLIITINNFTEIPAFCRYIYCYPDNANTGTEIEFGNGTGALSTRRCFDLGNRPIPIPVNIHADLVRIALLTGDVTNFYTTAICYA